MTFKKRRTLLANTASYLQESLADRNGPHAIKAHLMPFKSYRTRIFDTYTSDAGSNDKPWTAEVRSLASRIQEQARRCSQRNESSWRFACEPVILGRISSEVCW